MDGLWEFPALVVHRAGGRHTTADGLQIEPMKRRARVTHSITYRRLEVDVFEGRLLSEPRGPAYLWVTPKGARRLPTSSLVTKILDRVRD